MGELDTNLLTNQSLVGRKTNEIVDETLLEIEFYNYLGEPINPTQDVIVRSYDLEEYDITNEQTTHVIAHAEGRNIGAGWKIENNKMIVIGLQPSAGRTIDQVYYFSLKQLDTNDKSYTKFKFIQ